MHIIGDNTSTVTGGVVSFPGLSILLPGAYRLGFQCMDAAGTATIPPALTLFDGLPYGQPQTFLPNLNYQTLQGYLTCKKTGYPIYNQKWGARFRQVAGHDFRRRFGFRV